MRITVFIPLSAASESKIINRAPLSNKRRTLFTKIGTLGVHVCARMPSYLFYCLFAGAQP
jgi:hypothetical protein